MTLYLTPKDAAEQWQCPLGRTFSTPKAKAGCRGPSCPVWRWKPRLASDPGYAAAIKREAACQAQDYNSNKPEGAKDKSAAVFEKKATQAVTRNPEGYGIERTEGFCGLGGLPT